jgi:hypothetical protein
MHAIRFSVIAHTVQQHGLANSTQAHKQYTFGGSSQLGTLYSHLHGIEQRITAGKLWRRVAGARRKRVCNGVHGANIPKLGKLCWRNNIANLHQFEFPTATHKASSNVCVLRAPDYRRRAQPLCGHASHVRFLRALRALCG